MKNSLIFYILIFLLINSLNLNANLLFNNELPTKDHFYFDVFLGLQMSGIRKADFVSSNYSPYIQIGIGKEVTRSVSLAITYQGPYFYFIEDDYKHKYLFLDSELILNLNNTIKAKNSKFLNLNLILGPGYFYNYLSKKSNLCATIGLSNELELCNAYIIKFKLSGIAGWSIYQHDKDILPSISLGLSRNF